MLPSINRGLGGTFAFPDVCLTPMVPSPVPIPYPNFGFTAMSVPFSPKVMLTMVNAINMSTSLMLTTGDEGGVSHPTFKGAARYSMGNPIVYIHMLPSIMLCALSTGNNFNAPLGANLIPSVTNVFFTRREGEAPEREFVEGALRITEFSSELPSVVFRQLEGCDEALVIDLRGCPGGKVDAALQLADDFLPDGLVLAQRADEDGDQWPLRGRRTQVHRMPVAILVDAQTASAAEIFAGVLQHHGRARLFGCATYGKASAGRFVGAPEGGRFAAAGCFSLPDGQPIHGRGLTPDVDCEDPVQEVREWLKSYH